MSIAAEVKKQMAQYLEAFTAVVNDQYQRHVLEEEPFELSDDTNSMIASLEGHKSREAVVAQIKHDFQVCRKRDIMRNHSKLELARMTQDLEFCQNSSDEKFYQESGSGIRLGKLYVGDLHILRTLANVQPDDLQSYVGNHGINFDEA